MASNIQAGDVTPIKPSSDLATDAFLPYRPPANRNDANIAQVEQQFAQALGDALAALAKAGVEAYFARLATFLQLLTQSYDISVPRVGAFRITAMCLLGQYGAASIAVSKVFPTGMEVDKVKEYIQPTTNAIGSLDTHTTTSTERAVEGTDSRRQSAPVGPSRPPVRPLTRPTEFGPALALVHSVDAAGVQQIRPRVVSNDMHGRVLGQHSQRATPPPPPQFSPRPGNVPPPPPPPSPNRQLIPHQASATSYNPATYGAIPATGWNHSTSVPKRKPVNNTRPEQRTSTTLSYSTSSLTTTTQTAHQQSQQQSTLYFPPPPSTLASPPQQSPTTRTPSRQDAALTSPRPQQQRLHPAAAANRTALIPTQNQTRTANNKVRPGQQYPPRPANQRTQNQRPTNPKEAPRHVTSIGPAGQKGFTGPPVARPKASKMAKLKNFHKTPAGRIAMRVGTGMVVASLTGGLLGAGVGDMDFGGGGDGDLGGDVDIAEVGDEGFGDVEEVDGGYFGDETGAFEDEYVFADGGIDQYGYDEDYATFEDNLVEDGTYGTFEDGTVGDEGYGTFEDNLALDGGAAADGDEYGTFEDQAGYEPHDNTVDGGDGGGSVDNADLPGQVGPCFEDNIILSAAAG